MSDEYPDLPPGLCVVCARHLMVHGTEEEKRRGVCDGNCWLFAMSVYRHMARLVRAPYVTADPA